ncbi:MAG TPA: hypothetical protein EYP29_01835, partial [Thermoplasmata archaeon]|nr:hypothetical protein [Thermoplasmata archaeon]
MAEANKQGIRELILKADFAKALYTLEIISKENSSLQNSPHFYCLRGILEGLTNRKENALLYLRKAKEMSREQPSLFLDMMVVRFHVLFNEDRMADHLYNLFVEDHPESSLGWSERGIFLYHKGKMAPALESLNIALTFNKENIQALGYKALVHRKIASAEAKDIFRKFLLIEPRNGMEYLSKGEIYENLENYEKARAYISKVLEKSPANLAAIYLKRESFIKEGKFSLAKKFERKIKRMDFKIENLDSLPENRFYVLGKILFFLEQNRFLKNLGGVPVEAGNERELVSSFPSTSKNVERVGKSQIQMAVAKSFDEVQEEKVKIAENYFKKGKDKLKEKRYDEAI